MFTRRFLDTEIPRPPEPHRAIVSVHVPVIEVLSSDGKTVYPVTLDPPFCPCRDFQYRGEQRPCKHLNEARARAAESLEVAGAVL